MLRKILVVLEMIKFQHTVFALPFAAVGAAYAAEGLPTAGQCFWILLAMVGGRSAAMTFNRMADARFDAANPRTAARALPRGLVSFRFATGFLIASLALFFLSAGMLNRLVLALSPAAAAVILGYSIMKRITPLSHFALGLSLAMAPVGAWLAIRPEPAAFPLLLGAAVFFWVAGFDIIYACEDVEFDRRTGLRSIPAAVGVPASLRIAMACHGTALALLAAPTIFLGLGGWYLAAVALIAPLLAYEHALVRPDDLRRVNQAFFHVNAAVGLTLAGGAILELWRRTGPG
ncbi:MAG: UbiA family prenyltransferase [Planctomycetes bacterium]|nr:UbiA family prenyltransferase [Planctomycetota bacterium]